MGRHTLKSTTCFKKQQIIELYDAASTSVVVSFLLEVIVVYIMFDQIVKQPSLSIWLFLIAGITLLRGLDVLLFNRRIKKEDTQYNQYDFMRFTTVTVLSAIGWGLLTWNFYPHLTLDYQIYIYILMIGITAFSATSLSYSLIIVVPFILIILTPLVIRMHVEDSTFQRNLTFLTFMHFLFLTIGIIRVHKKYCEKIYSQIDYKIKEKEYQNLQYAIDKHAIHCASDAQGNLTYANDKLLKVSKYTREELLGNNYRIFESGEHPSFFWAELWQTISNGEIWHGEIKNKAKDGTRFWVDTTIVPFLDNQNRPQQYITIRSDISKLKELEQQITNEKNDALIRAKIARLLQKQDSLKERINLVLNALSKIGSHNQSRQEVYLVTKTTHKLALFAVQGEYSSDYDKKECKKRLVALFQRAISTGKIVILDRCSDPKKHNHQMNRSADHGYYIIPLMYQNKALGILQLSTKIYPSRKQSRLDTLRYIGDLIAMSIINEQVKSNLQQGRKYAEDLAQTKSDFLANMSHEIRTPMNGVLGMLGLLNAMPLDDKSKNYVETAHSSANMLLNVINDILDISKIESGKLHIETINFDLRKALEDTTDLLANLAHKNKIELSCFIPPDTNTFVKGDMLRIQQVVNNLMSNAIKFTHEGEVTLNVSTLKKSANTTTLRFEIIDTGIGIPEAKQKELFQAFTQADTSTSREYGGTGLGLSISKNLVEMMGGEIGVNSVVGKGSTFWFELSFDTFEQKANKTASLKGLRFLIIDDKETNCMILESYLQALGAESVIAHSGEQGRLLLDQAINDNQAFDILLLDMQMPNENGQQIAEKIRKSDKYSQLKIILLSSIALDVSMNTEGHYDLMLNKPVRQSFLYDAISTIIKEPAISTSGIATEQAPKSPEHTHSQPQKLKGSILLVDDSRVNQYVGKETLSKLGLDFDIAVNGVEAVDARKNKNFDVILMDCQMPVMDGYEATRTIRQYEAETNTNPIPIIALTANAMQGDKDKCVDAGMDDYLSKPYTIETLSAILNKYLTAQQEPDMRQTSKELAET